MKVWFAFEMKERKGLKLINYLAELRGLRVRSVAVKASIATLSLWTEALNVKESFKLFQSVPSE